MIILDNEANKRKILLITPDYMDYTSIMLDAITEYSNADTFLITTTGKKLKFCMSSCKRIQGISAYN